MLNGQDFCRILVVSDDGSNTGNSQYVEQLESHVCVDASVICHKSVEMETSGSFPPCVVTVDIEKGVDDVSQIDQDTCGSIKTEISLTVSKKQILKSCFYDCLAFIMENLS